MEPHNRPDGPPPPYSETDIYSHSHASRNEHLGGADDDVSIAPSSSHSNIIDTPPESPRDDTQYGFPGPGSDECATPSAQAYFDSRPPNRSSGPNITIVLEITPASAPSDFPYPNQVLDRDVSEQDWQTFINYLIPGHAARANSHIIARKLRMADDARSPGSEGIVEAQLAPLKSSPSVSVSPQNIDAVTREWNRGFFEPRGVTVRRTSPAAPAIETQVPGSETARANAADAEQAQNQPQQPSSWWRSPFGFVDGNNGSLRIGPLHIEGDRVALGSAFEADRNGVRWRGRSHAHPLFEASSRGVRWGEQPGPSLAHPHPHPHPFGRHGGYGGHPWGGPFVGGPARGRRGREHHAHRQRDHSRSSVSSSSSSSSLSSSDSDSSIGSLPDWDDLKDTQLPVTKRSVQAWLSHPDQPVTKNMLKQAKADIKAARKVPPVPHDPSWERSRENLRREVKDLLQQFKALKKQQRAARRTARKELRQQKRAAKQERRERKRAERRDRRANEHESRRAERATRRAERDADRHARRHRLHSAVPPMMAPGTTPVPPTPSVPPIPPVPHPFGGGFGGMFGRGGPFGARPTPPPRFGFGRGFDPSCSYGWGQPHDINEQVNRTVAEAMGSAEGEREKALAAAAQEREKALATAQNEREKAARVAGESRRAALEAASESHRLAMQAASESRRAAMEAAGESHRRAMAAAGESHRLAMDAARRHRANMHRSREAALLMADEQRRATTEAAATDAVSRGSMESRLAEAQALELEISAKAAQVHALGEQMSDAEKREQGYDEKTGSGSGGGKKTDVGTRGHNSRLIEQLEEEMERLGRRVEALRVEADEEFARQLADKGDDEWGAWK
ncbi:hypothetical protein F5Y10DRAFT_88905 [Nemania abortiva]|nr:hypothetical protein F5Y10DRAFT_88905 [Nemania abortiva]